MNSIKSLCSFLVMVVLPIGFSVAQTSGTTTTQPSSTSSTNRRQELYDQYHGVTKKTTSTSPINTPAPVSTTNAPQPQNNTYTNSQPVTTVNQSRSAITEPGTSGVRIGLRGGVTYSFFTEQQPLLKPDIGFVGGLVFNFGAGTLSFQPEVNYARYGLKLTDDFTGISVKGAADVIEVPLLLKISSGTYAGHRFFVNVGPYGSYLASISANGKKQSIDSSINRFAFGAALGLGAALKAGPGHITIEARGLYSFGDTKNGFSTDSKSVNSQLTIGYSFPLGSR